ncbi:uncharacterized protein LOC105688792 [Athalia rosae]|uniref:uncharacterized protein LOC105688792 n=1 Tax=Athalia rosae TaxID=37344 RepID=UPI0020336366|nr:uncharacterized protein LOC105688792 [Athalia rosae]
MAKIIIFLLAICYFLPSHEGAKINNHIKVLEAYKSIYYDPSTNLTLPSEIEDAGRFPFTRIGFRGLPCACEDSSCGCCAGINITRIKFDQTACANFTYDPQDLALRIQLSMNDRNVLTSMLSAKNPPPICAPLPWIPALEICLRFHDLTMPAKNKLQGCVDLETRFVHSPVLVLHFDCLQIGTDGIAWVKPDEVGGGSAPMIDYPDPEPSEPETYDEVEFESSEAAESPGTGSTSLTPEGDDQIGQLKL